MEDGTFSEGDVDFVQLQSAKVRFKALSIDCLETVDAQTTDAPMTGVIGLDMGAVSFKGGAAVGVLAVKYVPTGYCYRIDTTGLCLVLALFGPVLWTSWYDTMPYHALQGHLVIHYDYDMKVSHVKVGNDGALRVCKLAGTPSTTAWSCPLRRAWSSHSRLRHASPGTPAPARCVTLPSPSTTSTQTSPLRSRTSIFPSSH